VKSFQEYERLAEAAHGHICAGQILGLRMALFGLRLLGLDERAGTDRKRLVTFVEIDRCVTDAVSVVTGCRLGKRALKFRDFGKVAATFCDLQAGKAVRVIARASARERARQMHPEIEGAKQQQSAAYREMPDEELFDYRWGRVRIAPQDLPGYKAPKAVCGECGEEISFGREVPRDDRTLCRGCAGEQYFEPL
jgi:formylmethanofuran dehydrogenase subunit E